MTQEVSWLSWDQCLDTHVPGGAVVPAGLLYPSSQDADIIGHHVVERLQLLLDPLQLHGLRLSLLGPEQEKHRV